MKRKLLTVLAGMIFLASAATMAFAEDVYITKHGKKYHTADSRFIKGKEVEKLTREEAEARGYEPGQEFLEDQANTQKVEKVK